MDHSLENLGPDRFQQLVQALLIAANPKTICFPIGQPDGGRDAVLPVNFELGKDEFLVFQVKYSRHPAEVEDVSKWLLEKAEGELEKIERLKARGATQYFLVTNVSGTAHLNSGSIDKTLAALREQVGIPVHCWFRDDLNRLLDGQWDIKLRYSEVLSGHDFFRILVESAPRDQHERRINALRAFLADQYEEDVQVKFKQVELQNKLLDLFIDLPFRVTFRTKDKGAIYSDYRSAHDSTRVFFDDTSAVLTNQEDDDDTSGTASLLLGDWGQARLRQVVVEGAPGQGKSTLAQYVCQVHRIRILNKQGDLEKLSDKDRQSALRIPFKVDLRDLAAWLAGSDPFETSNPDPLPHEPRTVESFLARLVRLHSGGIRFDVNDLLELCKLAPLLVVLDGLDEVVEIKQRNDVVAAVTKALPRIRENCPHLGVIITSRPAAFANSPGFDASNFPHIELLSVKRSQITEYAERWMEVRGLNTRERDEFRAILKEKMTAPHLRDLSRNPMQLTILLSLILTQGSALPDKRTNLYDDYVDLFFSRESAKSPAVRKHIVLLKDLHRFLGWTLHASAETNQRKSSGRISADDLRITLNNYLVAEGHPTEVVEEIFGAMLERVVMVVPRIQGTYEFEVQPLREYFAARFLYDTASYSPTGKEQRGTKPDRFDAVARNFYWLNVVRFLAGCFSKGELLDLADRVKALIEDPLVGKTRHPVGLTAMLLADWVFEQSPKAVTQLVDLLSTPVNMQRLVSPTRYGGQDVVTLPSQSGGRRIFESAFELLEKDGTPTDRCRNLASLATTQSSPAECDQRWLESALCVSNPTKWLQIGRYLDSLSRVSDDRLEATLSKTSLNRAMAHTLLYAGRSGCVLSSEHNVLLLQNVFLKSRYYYVAPGSSQAPFYLLSFVLAQPPSSLQYLPDYQVEALSTFKDAALSEADRKLQGNFPFIKQAYELSAELSRGFAEAATVTQQLAVVENILERCRNVWGLRPAIAAALLECVSQRRVKASTAPFDFFAGNIPAMQRLRGAKARIGDVDWWLSSISQVTAAPKSLRLLLIEALFILCPTSIIASCEARLSEVLDTMSEGEWGALALTLHQSRGAVRRVSNKEEATKHLGPRLESLRFSFLLASRHLEQFGGPVFLKFFRTYSGAAAPFLEFKQGQAIQCAMNNAIEWDEALRIVRDSYERGIRATELDYRLRNGTVAMSMSVYSEILSNSLSYPTVLCDAAEAAAARAARKAVRPVSAIAKNERWFAFD
ncbi:NACHT domain-containing protein [Bradyrhizobium sp. 930_D9_N1_4]|uniref:NACHT domain-containing protein n=1 Tax=Bradyrhizobium sp. 930_D9_N1_4 TaxID=3240374 RepID=UPI003F8C8DB2